MAALASSAVALYPTGIVSSTEAPPNEAFPKGKDDRGTIQRSLKLTLTGQGGQTNTIGASALGFKFLTGCTNLWDAQNSKGYPAVIDPVNQLLILLDGSAAPAPVDVTSNAAYITVTGTVKGPSAS